MKFHYKKIVVYNFIDNMTSFPVLDYKEQGRIAVSLYPTMIQKEKNFVA